MKVALQMHLAISSWRFAATACGRSCSCDSPQVVACCGTLLWCGLESFVALMSGLQVLNSHYNANMLGGLNDKYKTPENSLRYC